MSAVRRTRIARAIAAAFAAALQLAATCAAADAGAASRPAIQGFDVQGHRGCRGRLPENSMAAFRRALELGVNTLELDLQLTRDRVLVVHHDQALDPKRCVRDGGRAVRKRLLKELDYEELADVDCGSRPSPKFPEQEAVPGARIPRLEDVLELAEAAGYPVRLNLEIKMQKRSRGLPVDEFARLLVAAVRSRGLEERTVVQSFDAEALRAVGRADGSLRRSLLIRRFQGYGALLERAGNPAVLSPRFSVLTAARVREIQARDLAVIPWTVNDPGDIRRAISWGVDGIITDYPGRVIEILRAGSPGS